MKSRKKTGINMLVKKAICGIKIFNEYKKKATNRKTKLFII